jgi:hypothetical protein
MTATLAVLRTRLRSRLNEPSPAHWTDVQLGDWINEGAREVARQAECLSDTGTVSVTAGVRDYSLSTLSPQPLRIHRVEYEETGSDLLYPLEYRDYNTMDNVWGAYQKISSGRTAYWTAWGYFPNISVVLYPIPQSNATLTLYYYRNPTPVATDGTGDTDVVECPDGWEDCIVDYAEYRAMRNDKQQNWTDAQTEFQNRLTQLINITTRPDDATGLITTPTGGFIPGWLANPDY